jgi:fatty acid desaturase
LPAATRTLRDSALKQKLQQLRRTDNFTNWYYIGRTYALIALAAGLFIALHQWLTANDGSLWWLVPAALAAIVVIGASQHQLAGATHEATHYTLFRNRWLNELASDWLCMFPLLSTTYIFRLHHLPHHQFINDPERDPDFAQLRRSGHWLDFPIGQWAFLGMLLRQLTLFPLARYILVRARYNAIGVEQNSSSAEGRRFSPWPMRLALAYLLVLPGGLIWATWSGDALLLALIPAAGFAAVTCCYLAIPAHRYPVGRIQPVISPRTTHISRTAHATLLLGGVSWAEYLTGLPAWGYFLGLWTTSLFTTFALFMILRQLVQHGNGDRGWLTNTRTFLVNPFIRYAVFPFGMDYHLPHHMFATIPHYRLPQLHRLLREYPEYAERGTVVEGYFFPADRAADRNPTVLEVLGPAYAQRGSEVFIDDTNQNYPGGEPSASCAASQG